MTSKTSRCIICGLFFNSKKELREHKDKKHRITNSKMAVTAGRRIIGPDTTSSSPSTSASFIKAYNKLQSSEEND